MPDNAITRELARLLHGQYVEDTEPDKEREQRERNQEQIDKYWDSIKRER